MTSFTDISGDCYVVRLNDISGDWFVTSFTDISGDCYVVRLCCKVK